MPSFFTLSWTSYFSEGSIPSNHEHFEPAGSAEPAECTELTEHARSAEAAESGERNGTVAPGPDRFRAHPELPRRTDPDPTHLDAPTRLDDRLNGIDNGNGNRLTVGAASTS